MRIRVHDDIEGLAVDLTAISMLAPADMAETVRSNVEAGSRRAQAIARSKAGPHGKNYYKRITAEMTGPMTGEYGPKGDPKTEFVGVGFRHGRNNDLPQSADVIGPRFANDVANLADRWFW